MPHRLHEVLNLIHRIVDCLPDADTRVAEVSGWSVGQHIEHVARATSAFAILLMRGDGNSGDDDPTPLKEELFRSGSIPRGMFEAPEGTQPGQDTSQEALKSLLLKTRNRVSRLELIGVDASANHPYLGTMQRDEVIDFLAIHLKHHLTIIEDLMKSGE